MVAKKIVSRISQNLRLPQKNLSGWIALQFFKRKNLFLEVNAARLCSVQSHHKVLEIGFGPGYGIQAAYNYIKDGDGKVYGIDLSDYMWKTARKLLRQQIKENKVELLLGSVMNLPYNSDTFDRAFHCNCFYFWPNMLHGAEELYRVLKPNSFMVTTINLDAVDKAKKRGLLEFGNPDLVGYMAALENACFKNVKLEYLEDSGKNYQAIFASTEGKSVLDGEKQKN